MTTPEQARIAELEAEVERLRGALVMVELSTATGDGLTPDEAVRLSQAIGETLAQQEKG